MRHQWGSVGCEVRDVVLWFIKWAPSFLGVSPRGPQHLQRVQQCIPAFQFHPPDAIKPLEGPGGVLSKQQSKQSRMEQRYCKMKAKKCNLRGLLMFWTALIQRCRVLQRFWNLIANYEPRLKHEEAARLYAEAAGAYTHSHTLTQQHTRTRSD